MQQLTLCHLRCGLLSKSGGTKTHFCSVATFESWKRLCDYGRLEEALQALDLMQKSGAWISTDVFGYLLQGCLKKRDLAIGRKVHCLIVRSGFESNSFLGSHLIRVFASCGSLLEASQVFGMVHEPSAYTWAAIILAHAGLGQAEQAFKMYHHMKESSVKPNHYVYVAIIKACINVEGLEEGKAIHSHIIESGFELNVIVSNTLIDMYVKCGNLKDARRVFDKSTNRSVVTWTAMISGYSLHGHGEEALMLFQQMQLKGMDPTNVTLISILKACSSIAALDKGKVIHSHITEKGLESNIFIGNTLLDMYAKSGSLEDAHNVFSQLGDRDIVTWSAMIAGCAQHEQGHQALRVFQQMQQEGIKPNRVTFISVLKGCSNVAALDQGKLIHAHIIKSSFESDLLVGSTLVEMYAKCGNLKDAHSVFQKIPNRNVVTWTAMLAGYALHGHYRLVLEYFDSMQQERCKPNDVTFVCLLSACSHLGLLAQGCYHFESMMDKHGIIPTVEHYYGLVDLFGRVGHLHEAEHIIHTIPFLGSHVVGWRSLLSHCKMHGNIALGRGSFDHIAKTDQGVASGYMLMLNTYANTGMWEDVWKIDDVRKSSYVLKKPGRAFIEVDSKVYEFIVGDKSHPSNDEICAKLRILTIQMDKGGYLPDLG